MNSLSREVIKLCNEIFLADDMMCEHSREKAMVASYLGGCAIASSYVGLVHHALSRAKCCVWNTPLRWKLHRYGEDEKVLSKTL